MNRQQNDTDKLTPALVAESKDLWILLTGNNLDERGLFTDQHDAQCVVAKTIASGLTYRTELKREGGDDISDLPEGSITGLSWRCPMRPMTREEVLNHPNKQFTEAWLVSPPNTDDYDAAEASGVSFIADPVSSVMIDRVSRYIGYLMRASVLNDKRSEVRKLNRLYREFKRKPNK